MSLNQNSKYVLSNTLGNDLRRPLHSLSEEWRPRFPSRSKFLECLRFRSQNSPPQKEDSDFIPDEPSLTTLDDMFGWGSTIHGELGFGGIEEEHIFTPKSLDWLEAKSVIKAALGDNHTLFLTKDGKVYSCGNNDYGQLGHDQPRKRPRMSLFSM